MADPRTGCILLDDGLTAADVWQLLHSNASEWEHVPKNSNFFKIREMLDQADFDALNSLTKFPAKKWARMCDGIGWTAYGAIALSWCDGGQLSEVWKGWELSEFPLKPEPEYIRPAKFINPALLPQTTSLTEIVIFAGNQTFPICGLIAAINKPLQFDMELKQMKSASHQILSFLKENLEGRAELTELESQLKELWETPSSQEGTSN